MWFVKQFPAISSYSIMAREWMEVIDGIRGVWKGWDFLDLTGSEPENILFNFIWTRAVRSDTHPFLGADRRLKVAAKSSSFFGRRFVRCIGEGESSDYMQIEERLRGVGLLIWLITQVAAITKCSQTIASFLGRCKNMTFCWRESKKLRVVSRSCFVGKNRLRSPCESRHASVGLALGVGIGSDVALAAADGPAMWGGWFKTTTQPFATTA